MGFPHHLNDIFAHLLLVINAGAVTPFSIKNPRANADEQNTAATADVSALAGFPAIPVQ